MFDFKASRSTSSIRINWVRDVWHPSCHRFVVLPRYIHLLFVFHFLWIIFQVETGYVVLLFRTPPCLRSNFSFFAFLQLLVLNRTDNQKPWAPHVGSNLDQIINKIEVNQEYREYDRHM